MSDKRLDDRIADALLNGSVYEEVSTEMYRWFHSPVTDRLRWQSVLLLGIAAIYPVVALLPDSVKQAYLGTTDVASTSPAVAILAAAALVFTTLAATGHLSAVYLRLKWEPDISRSQARELISLEETSSLIGFGTAGAGAFIAHVFAAIGFGGIETVTQYGVAPYGSGGGIITLKLVAIIAVVLGALLYLAAYVAEALLDKHGINYR